LSGEFKMRAVARALTSKVQHNHLLTERTNERLEAASRVNVEINIQEFSCAVERSRHALPD